MNWKNFAQGVVAGGVALVIGGFGWSGWVLESSAEQLAQQRVAEAQTAMCVANAKAQPDQIAGLKAADYGKHTDFVVKAGWANLPGFNTDQIQKLARDCSTAVRRL